MKKIIMSGVCVLLLSGCTPGIVNGNDHKTEYQARERCASDARVQNGSWAGYFSTADFKVTKLSNGDWQCHQVFGDELAKQKEDSTDAYKADEEGLTLSEYRKKVALQNEKERQKTINFYAAKEELYESYRKDGKVHVDSYRLSDGSIKTISIHGNKRCESHTTATTSVLNCN